MDADAVTYFRPGIDDHVGVKTRVIAYLAVMTNLVAAQKRGPRADAHVVTYDDIRTDVRRGVYLRGVGDHCARMDARKIPAPSHSLKPRHLVKARLSLQAKLDGMDKTHGARMGNLCIETASNVRGTFG
jgi:hypothetical protein